MIRPRSSPQTQSGHTRHYFLTEKFQPVFNVMEALILATNHGKDLLVMLALECLGTVKSSASVSLLLLS